MQEPMSSPASSVAQAAHTPARNPGILRRLAPKLQYALICAALAGILKLGHATHWSIPWPDSAAEAQENSTSTSENESVANSSKASSSSDSTSPVAPATESESTSGAVTLSDDQLRKSGVELHRVGRRTMDQALTVHGVVEYNRNHVAQLSSRVPGIVWRVERQAGETIRKGDVLAIIEAIEVGQVKADLLRAIVEADLKRTTVERLRSAGEALAERFLREAEADQRQAHIKVRNLIQTLVNLGLPVSLEELQSLDDEQRAKKLQFLGLPDSVVATLDPTKTTDNLVPLIAPFDGVVIGREITLGETVSPNDSHFVIADVSRMWVTLEVRKEDANLVRMGQEVQFQADGVPGKLTGIIDWISTEVNEETRTLQVRAEVPNAIVAEDATSNREQRMLRANTFGTGAIVVRRDPVAVVVPNDAVHYDGQEHFVFVREDGQFRRQVIVPGVVAGRVTEVRSGLEEGATIAAVGSHLIKSEMSLVAMQQ